MFRGCQVVDVFHSGLTTIPDRGGEVNSDFKNPAKQGVLSPRDAPTFDSPLARRDVCGTFGEFRKDVETLRFSW